MTYSNMLQYITTLIDKYSYKPSPNEIHDKFDISIFGLVDKRTHLASYNWRRNGRYTIGLDEHNNIEHTIFHNLNDGSNRRLGLLVPLSIRISNHQLGIGIISVIIY